MRAARALIRWSADDLAQSARLGVATIRRAEGVDGPPTMTEANAYAIERTLRAAGIALIDGGVKFRELQTGDRVRYAAGSIPDYPEPHVIEIGVISDVEVFPTGEGGLPMIRARFGDFETPWSPQRRFEMVRSAIL